MGTSTNCGNGFLEPGETCEGCPADCVIGACTAAAPVQTFRVNLTPPPFQDPSSVTVLIGYRSTIVSLPGNGSAPAARVRMRPSGATVTVNDLDYALRTVVTRPGGLTPGRLFVVDFDPCAGAAAPTTADFACTVEGCANQFGPIEGCTCSVVNP
jgi:hypothetical protein